KLNAQTEAANGKLTFDQLADRYLEGHVRIPTRRLLSRKLMELHVRCLREVVITNTDGLKMPLGQRTVESITKTDVENVRRIWRAHQPRAKGGEVGTNRLLSRLRHMFNWAIAEELADHTPFKRHGVTVV